MNATLIVMLPERGSDAFSPKGRTAGYPHLCIVEVREHQPVASVHSHRTGLMHVEDIRRLPPELKGKSKFDKLKSLEEQWIERLAVGERPIAHRVAKRAWSIDQTHLAVEEREQLLSHRQITISGERFVAALRYRAN